MNFDDRVRGCEEGRKGVFSTMQTDGRSKLAGVAAVLRFLFVAFVGDQIRSLLKGRGHGGRACRMVKTFSTIV